MKTDGFGRKIVHGIPTRQSFVMAKRQVLWKYNLVVFMKSILQLTTFSVDYKKQTSIPFWCIMSAAKTTGRNDLEIRPILDAVWNKPIAWQSAMQMVMNE